MINAKKKVQRAGASQTVGTLALLSSLRAVANPRQSREVKAEAFAHLSSHFKRLTTSGRVVREYAAGVGNAGKGEKTSPRDLIAALRVLGSSTASDDAKATALDKLVDHFDAMLIAQDKANAKMTAALKRVQALRARVAKPEKASAVRTSTRAKTPAASSRRTARPKDGIVAMIEATGRNVLRTLPK